MPRPRTAAERDAARATNDHADHDLQWVEYGATTYTVHAVHPDGRIIINDSPEELDTHESYLWCETCGERCTDAVGITSNDLTILTDMENNR